MGAEAPRPQGRGGARGWKGRPRRRGPRRGGGGQGAPRAGELDLSDARTLEHLRESGADLNVEHEVMGFMYFPGEAAARRALPQLEQAGYTPFCDPVGDGRWVVEAVRIAVPSMETAAGMRSQLRAIAGSAGGQYDGWYAEPLEEEGGEPADSPLEPEAAPEAIEEEGTEALPGEEGPAGPAGPAG